MRADTLLLLSLTLLLINVQSAYSYRLPRTVLPSFYNISIKPYLLESDGDKQFSFEGDVSIALQAVEFDVRQITLHKDYIDITDCWLYDENSTLVESFGNEQLLYEATKDQLTVPLSQALVANTTYTLRFNYTGQIRNGTAGLFRTSYVDAETGNVKWLGVTQLQRIDARVVLPCFDEPAFKSRFQLHISRPNNYNSISNTKLITSVADGTLRHTDHFDVTPLMSTYLLAFIVSEYTARSSASGDFAVISRPEFYNKTEFSYRVGLQTVEAYDVLFKQPYKQLGNEILQFASSPSFPFNGMENWGLIIYSDAILVQEPGYTDGWSDKELTIRIIAHETSHLWFGDSVTFSWWSYFWLNEAFARYYEYFMAHQLSPEYHLDEQFVVRQLQLIFDIDSVYSAQPLTSPEASIETPSDIAYKFSSIAYAKGASIVRMWHNAMGEENFNAAISNYLREHHLSNTEPADLFAHLKQQWPQQQNVDLDTFFSDYTEQVGVPMLLVNATQRNKRITVQQQRFLLNSSDGSDASIRYTIPITYATDLSSASEFRNLTPRTYFNKIADILVLDFEEPVDWILFNLRSSNYQRVLYDTPLLDSLQAALAKPGHSGVPAENRAQIIDDLFTFARVGMIDYAEVFAFLEYLKDEIEFTPWYAMFSNLQTVALRLTEEQLPNFSQYLSDITVGLYTYLSPVPNNDSAVNVYSRSNMVFWLCKYQNKNCNRQVQDVMELIKMGLEKPVPDFREIFFCAASRAGDYDTILAYYYAETYPSEQLKLWRAASCTKNYRDHYEQQILENATTVAYKKAGILQLYYANPENISPVFEMLTENITQLAESLGSWSETAYVLRDLAACFTTRTQQQQLEKFTTENELLFGNSISILQTALQIVENNLEWAEQRLGRLVVYLDKRNGAVASRRLGYLAWLLVLPAVLFNH